LLKAGLADEKSVKSALKQKRRQNKKPKKARGEAPEITRQVEQVQLDKANRDRELNRRRQLELEKKAQLAQIQQLIETTRIDRSDGKVSYHFAKDGIVKSIDVTVNQQRQLARNQIAIVIFAADQVELVPRAVAEKIAQRDASFIIENTSEEPNTSAEDDPYADYQIPDDLVW